MDAEISPIVDGERYKRTHRASVIGILGDAAPPVISKGSQFYNLDRWTLRYFTTEMCQWAQDNPGCIPTKDVIQTWTKTANDTRAPQKCIVIANTPDKLPLRTALALTGGGYHEALHTYLSCKRYLRAEEMVSLVVPRWALVKDWSKYHKALMEWYNIIEDIRIERRGREEFEGTFVPLCDLQDFILDLEAKGETDIRDYGGKVPSLSVIVKSFRDVGLGYNTDKQVVALDKYRKEHPKAVDLVLDGPLSPYLKEAIGLGKEDDTGSLKVALGVIAKLAEIAGESEDSEKPLGGKQKCPRCGASPSDLRIRPKSDGNGRKVRGVGIITCTKCGWQDEIQVESEDFSDEVYEQEEQEEEVPQFEGTEEDFDDWFKDDGDPTKKIASNEEEGEETEFSEGGTPDEGEEPDKGEQPSKGEKFGRGEQGEPSDEGSQSDMDGGEGAGSEYGEGSSGSEEWSEEAQWDGDFDDEKGEGSEEEQGAGGGKSTPSQGSEFIGGTNQSAEGAGGHYYDPDQHEGWEYLVKDALTQVLDDLGILDNSSALGEEIQDVAEKEDSHNRTGELSWKPYDTSLDAALLVSPSAKGIEYDRTQATKLVKSVTSESAYLRARLRNVVRSLEMTSTYHGVPRGRGLSQRFLVDSKASLKGGQFPKKAYYRKSQRIDMTMACAVVLDQSGSMQGILPEVSRILVALTEPFDALHCPTLAIGFRNGDTSKLFSYWMMPPEVYTDGVHYHRYHGVRYDIFKNWDERFATVKWRFANTRAEGGTPMSDGVQYALKALSARDEAHRFLFVVTDGNPDPGHLGVITKQIRLAKEAGVHIIGVGLGNGAVYVKSLFPDHVWAADVSEIPALLVEKLNDLADIRGGKRGRRVKDD